MDLHGILERVERRLTALNMKADRASREAGRPDAIRNLRRAVKSGEGGITLATIEALAPVLKTTVIWLLKEEGPESPDQPDKLYSIQVYGDAGAEAAPFRLLARPRQKPFLLRQPGLAPIGIVSRGTKQERSCEL